MPYPHAFIKLTPEEQVMVSDQLRRLAREGKIKERQHLQVIYFSNSGLTFQQIMKRFEISYMMVRRCIYAYRKEGLSSPYFMGKPRP